MLFSKREKHYRRYVKCEENTRQKKISDDRQHKTYEVGTILTFSDRL